MPEWSAAFIGLGRMGEALARCFIASGAVPAARITAYDKDGRRLQAAAEALGVAQAASAADAVRGRDLVILAVKPGDLPPVLAEIAPALQATQVVVSIAAGVPTSAIRAALSGASPPGIVRVMPSVACTVREACTAVASDSPASRAAIEGVVELFRSAGAVVEVEERLMDAVTGLSASGIAYVFVMIEALADGGVAAGLPRAAALQMAAQTVLGAAKMTLATGKHPGELKDMVTSPAGTTIAGLRALEKRGFRGAVIEAVRAAAERAKELAFEPPQRKA
jgi:pyrroline-5-carboxylate reductase